jgi:hypothetical protein
MLPRPHVGSRNERGFDTETAQQLEQLHARAKNALRGDDVLAAFHQSHYASEDRRHAGSGGDAALRAFERCEPLLQCCHGRIGVARIHHARIFARETRRRLRRVLENEARRQVQRLGMLVELAAVNARAHRQGLELKLVPPHCLIPVCRWYRHDQ